ncbi:MFS transporter [Metarhizium robertsii]|uniref:MFS transporter n=1 Tax=Metarhizium robertsii TaxID=568076 RepID=A0A014N6B8_9HYPO|nr:MFS transporter [Metarhizium robertsii]
MYMEEICQVGAVRLLQMADQDRLRGFYWRSKPSFIIVTVALGLFTDLFFYGIMVPVVPFMLRDRLSIPGSQIQSCTSSLITAYAGPSVLFSLPPGWVADKIGSRQPTFVADLWMQVTATTVTSSGQRAAIVIIARFVQCSSLATAVVQITGFAMLSRQSKLIFQDIRHHFYRQGWALIVGGILYGRRGTQRVFGSAIGILSLKVAIRSPVFDKKVIACYDAGSAIDPTAAPLNEREPWEDEPLLHSTNSQGYNIQGQVGNLGRTLPILYCFRELGFSVAFVLILVQALPRGIFIFEVTVPTEAQHLFHFSAQIVGFLVCTLLMA